METGVTAQGPRGQGRGRGGKQWPRGGYFRVDSCKANGQARRREAEHRRGRQHKGRADLGSRKPWKTMLRGFTFSLRATSAR